jgi:hypothetical protein
MTFVWPDYVNVAEDLLMMNRPTACAEAVARAAVSRAYYAVHHTARQLTTDRAIMLPKRPNDDGGIHQQVIDAIFSVKHPAWAEAGQFLDTLRRLRVDADYHVPLPVDPWGSEERSVNQKATYVVMMARSLIRVLQSLPPAPP